MSKFYEYDQNNSGGYFESPAWLVYVEADSAEEADQIAERHGLYFDGVDSRKDCECCGDRWWRASKYGEYDDLPPPRKYGDTELIVYKDRVEERRVVRDNNE